MKHRGRGGGETGKDLNEPAFLRDEDPTVRRKANRGRRCQPGEHDGFGEPRRQGRGLDGAGDRAEQACQGCADNEEHGKKEADRMSLLQWWMEYAMR